MLPPLSPLHRQGLLFTARPIQVPGIHRSMIWYSVRIIMCIQALILPLFDQWTGMEVRLDVWHFMRRMGRGFPPPLWNLSVTALQLRDDGDYKLLISSKRAELAGEGIPNPFTRTTTKSITRKELARHCRRRTRGGGSLPKERLDTDPK
jgi:hypothetical protein